MTMPQTLALVKLYRRYFTRRVLSTGPLRSTLVRLIAGAMITAPLGAMSLGSFLFLGSTGMGEEELDMMLQVASVSLLFWILVLLLFVKVLFLRSSAFLGFTLQLPVTNRQRTSALVAFEAFLVVITSLFLVTPLALAMTLRFGVSSVPVLLSGLLFPAVTFYLVCAITFNAAEGTLGSVRLKRVATPGAIFAIGLLAGLYNSKMPSLISAMTGEYLEKRVAFHFVSLYTYIAAKHGNLPSLLVFLCLTALLLPAAVISTPSRAPISKSFFKTRPSVAGLFSAYVSSSGRRTETMMTVALSYVIALFLLLNGKNYQAAAGICSLQVLYAHSGTTPLRLLPGRHYSPHSEYCLILLSQLALSYACAGPLLVVIFVDEGFLPFFVTCLGLALGVLVANFLGILFPPDRDNPFSVFISLTLLMAVAVSTAAVIGVLALPEWAILLAGLGAVGSTVFYSITGIETIERKARYASR